MNGIKNKNIKNSLGAKWNASHLAVRLCALRHWKRVSMPPTTQSLRHPLTRAIHFAPRIKTARRFTAKNPWWKNDLRSCVKSPKTISHGRDAIFRVRDKLLIFNMILQLWADVKYHVPTGFGFSPKASGFYPFADATDLKEVGVGDVVWLIQASAWNQTCHSTNDRCEALASPKGCFLCFCFSPPVFIH